MMVSTNFLTFSRRKPALDTPFVFPVLYIRSYVFEDDHADLIYNALPEASLRQATGEEE